MKENLLPRWTIVKTPGSHSTKRAKGGESMRTRNALVLLLVWLVAAGCAFDVYHLSSTPTKFTQQIEAPRSFIIKDDVLITRAPCGYKRTLRENTRWDLCGTIPEGEVYKSRDQVLTVECSHVYEAYLVVSNGFLTGFYLPVEKEFVSISEKMELPIK
jgi:hypothetical protein